MAGNVTGLKHMTKQKGKLAERDIRRQKALQLCIQGKTVREIGPELGISYVQAHRDIKAALDESAQRRKDIADKIIDLELNRLDKMLSALEPQLNVGDTKAIECALKIMQRRAKYLGLDKEQHVKISGELVAGVLVAPAGVSPEEWQVQMQKVNDEQREQGLLAEAIDVEAEVV